MPFLGVPIRRGEITKTRISVGEFSDGSPVALPVVTIGGTTSGPTVHIQAGIHGDELTGIEICRRALADLRPADLAGNVVVVPLVNLPSHLTRTRGYLHEERWLIDINRIFPGNPHGLLTERIANAIFEEFVKQADLTIDLHSALDGCDIAPFCYVDPDDDTHGTLAPRESAARAFGTPYVYYKKRGAAFGTSDLTRSMSNQADLAGKAVLVAEMGESRRVSTDLVPLGVRGIRSVLASMKMLEAAPSEPVRQRRFTEIHLVHADRGGGLRMAVDLRAEMKKGDAIAEIVDVFGEVTQTLRAPVDGFVLRAMRLGSVSTGAEVAWIAR
jgi:predicted deacylase